MYRIYSVPQARNQFITWGKRNYHPFQVAICCQFPKLYIQEVFSFSIEHNLLRKQKGRQMSKQILQNGSRCYPSANISAVQETFTMISVFSLFPQTTASEVSILLSTPKLPSFLGEACQSCQFMSLG